MKPRKPIKKVSDRQKKRMAEYRIVKEAYMKAHPWCEACPTRGFKSSRPSTDLHHRRGRAGKLLTDTRWFAAVCRDCHNWVGSNPLSARIAGLICAEGKWNTPER